MALHPTGHGVERNYLMGFDAGQAVEPLGYDFTSCGGGAGPIKEPDNPQIAQFWSSYSGFFREQRDRMQEWRDKYDKIDQDYQAAVAGLSNDVADSVQVQALQELRRQRIAQIEADQEADNENTAQARVKQRCEIFAAVCSNDPDYDALHALPGRILDAFEQYLVDELSPKGSKSASNN